MTGFRIMRIQRGLVTLGTSILAVALLRGRARSAAVHPESQANTIESDVYESVPPTGVVTEHASRFLFAPPAVEPRSDTRLPSPLLSHRWQLRDEKHWQIESAAPEEPEVTDAREGTRGSCPVGMVEVDGRMKVDQAEYLEVMDELQKSTCTAWIDRSYPERCARFDRAEWLRLSEDLPTTHLRFCIDRYEYPDRRGAYPWIVVTWNEAGDLCAKEGKRLCSEKEWTFACEGEESSPYPYGYDRDADACVIDRPWKVVDEVALEGRTDERAIREIDWLWQGEPSGSRPNCRSPFGVYDMTGNVDEWTVSIRPGERPSILKGGYWGPIRARCRPSTRAHGEDFSFYQQGFRCCADRPADKT
jgi:formylglycine-generating enzyme